MMIYLVSRCRECEKAGWLSVGKDSKYMYKIGLQRLKTPGNFVNLEKICKASDLQMPDIKSPADHDVLQNFFREKISYCVDAEGQIKCGFVSGIHLGKSERNKESNPWSHWAVTEAVITRWDDKNHYAYLDAFLFWQSKDPHDSKHKNVMFSLQPDVKLVGSATEAERKDYFLLGKTIGRVENLDPDYFFHICQHRAKVENPATKCSTNSAEEKFNMISPPSKLRKAVEYELLIPLDPTIMEHDYYMTNLPLNHKDAKSKCTDKQYGEGTVIPNLNEIHNLPPNQKQQLLTTIYEFLQENRLYTGLAWFIDPHNSHHKFQYLQWNSATKELDVDGDDKNAATVYHPFTELLGLCRAPRRLCNVPGWENTLDSRKEYSKFMRKGDWALPDDISEPRHYRDYCLSKAKVDPQGPPMDTATTRTKEDWLALQTFFRNNIDRCKRAADDVWDCMAFIGIYYGNGWTIYDQVNEHNAKEPAFVIAYPLQTPVKEKDWSKNNQRGVVKLVRNLNTKSSNPVDMNPSDYFLVLEHHSNGKPLRTEDPGRKWIPLCQLRDTFGEKEKTTCWTNSKEERTNRKLPLFPVVYEDLKTIDGFQFKMTTEPVEYKKGEEACKKFLTSDGRAWSFFEKKDTPTFQHTGLYEAIYGFLKAKDFFGGSAWWAQKDDPNKTPLNIQYLKDGDEESKDEESKDEDEDSTSSPDPFATGDATIKEMVETRSFGLCYASPLTAKCAVDDWEYIRQDPNDKSIYSKYLVKKDWSSEAGLSPQNAMNRCEKGKTFPVDIRSKRDWESIQTFLRDNIKKCTKSNVVDCRVAIGTIHGGAAGWRTNKKYPDQIPFTLWKSNEPDTNSKKDKGVIVMLERDVRSKGYDEIDPRKPEPDPSEYYLVALNVDLDVSDPTISYIPMCQLQFLPPAECFKKSQEETEAQRHKIEYEEISWTLNYVWMITTEPFRLGDLKGDEGAISLCNERIKDKDMKKWSFYSEPKMLQKDLKVGHEDWDLYDDIHAYLTDNGYHGSSAWYAIPGVTAANGPTLESFTVQYLDKFVVNKNTRKGHFEIKEKTTTIHHKNTWVFGLCHFPLNPHKHCHSC